MTAPLPRRGPAPPPQVVERGHGQSTSWWTWLSDDDPTPELRWPGSVGVFDRMYKQDSQIRSVVRAVTLPVRQARWRIHPGEARDEVVTQVATNLGLPIVGESDAPIPAKRERDRFSWKQHLEWALLCTVYGHMFFEQVYRLEGGVAYLRKLAPRWPKTIEAINTAPDGGLVSITQRPPRMGVGTPSQVQTSIEIPVGRLVAYSHEREGGNWQGQSLLRPAYKNWLLKDDALRTWSQTVARNGMGVPHYTASEDEDSLEAGRLLAQSYRAGAAAGGAGPAGSRMELLGVQGALPNIGELVRYHDEAMAKAVLAHFMNLGQTQGTGSYALGASFMDFFILSLDGLAGYVADVATQHVVEDLVDLNYGPEEPAPRVTYDPIGQNPSAIVGAVQALIAAGAIFPDPALDAFVRAVVGLPPKAPLPNAQTPAGAAEPPPGTPGAPPASQEPADTGDEAP